MKKETTINNFGKRLARIRKTKGLTQKQLADKIGVTRRIIVYYEAESKYPPTHLIAPLSKALNVTTDELLGLQKIKETLNPEFASLWRRLKILETFSEKDRKAILQHIDVIDKKNKAHQNT